MNFQVNLNICRVCMKTESGQPLVGNAELQRKFEYATRLQLSATDNMPRDICTRCLIRLNLTWQFIQLARSSEQNLKAFLAKISSDFQLVTQSSTTTSDVVPQIDDAVHSEELPVSVDSNEDADIFVYVEDGRTTLDLLVKPEMAAIDAPSTIVSYAPKKSNSTKRTTQAGQSLLMTHKSIGVDAEQSKFNSPSPAIEMLEESQDQNQDTADLVVYDDTEYTDAEPDEVVQVKQESVDLILEANSSEADVEMLVEEEETVKINLVDRQLAYLNDAGELLLGGGGPETVDEPSYDDAADETIEFLKEKQEYDGDTMIAEIMDEEVLNDTIVEKVSETEDNYAGGGNDQDGSAIAISTVQPRQTKQRSPRKTSGRGGGSKAKPTKMLANDGKLFCEKCERDFTTRANLKRHMVTHNGDRPFPCEVCHKSFTQSGSLKQHMYTHTGEKPFVCKECGRGFTQCKSLVFHMRRHSGVKPFHCDKCDLFFRQKDALKVHILKHHVIASQEGNVRTHTCITCRKTLATKEALHAHMKRHLNASTSTAVIVPALENSMDGNPNELIFEFMDGTEFLSEKGFLEGDDEGMADSEHLDRPSLSETSTSVINMASTSTDEPRRAKKYQCRKCYKCFALEKSLIRHLAIHDPPQAEMFQCKPCKVAFDTHYALKVHRVLEHKEKDICLNDCEECQLEFSTTADLTEHMRSHHIHELAQEEEQEHLSFKCPLCANKQFHTENQFMEHMLTHEM